jgi:hypothetical protein
MMIMYVNETNILNKKVLEYITRVKRQGNSPLVAGPDSVAEPYMNQGSHPEIVERVWDGIGASLPEDCRCLVYGTPALVHPKTGIIFVFCNGTSYCIRLTKELIEKALMAGAKTYQKWTDGGDMDTLRDLGPDWVFGGWLNDEITWCNRIWEELTNPQTGIE